MANAGAGGAAGVLLQGGSPGAAAGILAALSAFAGVTSMASGTRTDTTEDTLDEIVLRLRKLMHEHRTLCEVFAHGDPALAAERLRSQPELLAFLEKEAIARESDSEQFRLGLNVLIDDAIEQGRFRADAIAALAGLDAKMDAVLDGQQRVEAKVDDVAQYLIVQNQQLHAENRGLAVENESLRNQVRAALQRVADAETAAGRDPLKRLEELRQGDAHDLLAFLDEQIDKDELDLIEKHRERAAVAYTVGEIDKAEASLRKILALDPNDIDAVNRMGQVHILRGELEQADAALRRAMQLAGQHGSSQAIVFSNFGKLMYIKGDYDGAQAMHRKALAIHQQVGHMEGVAIASCNLGVLLMMRGDLDAAEAMYRSALAIHVQSGNKKGMADNYANIGLIQRSRGNLSEAESLLRDSLAIEVQLGCLEGMASDYSSIGNILQGRDDLSGAEAMHRKALAIHEQLNHKKGMASDFGNLGNVLFKRRDFGGAEAMYRKALAIDEQLSSQDGIANQYGNLGNVLHSRGDLGGAETMYKKAMAIDEQLGRKEGVANAYANLGSIAEQRNDVAEARRLWILARDLFAEIGARPEVERVQGWLDGLPPA